MFGAPAHPAPSGSSRASRPPLRLLMVKTYHSMYALTSSVDVTTEIASACALPKFCAAKLRIELRHYTILQENCTLHSRHIIVLTLSYSIFCSDVLGKTRNSVVD